MKALGLVVSDKNIFENCVLKTYFLTPWPTYATNQNHLNNFGKGPPRDHACEVWSNSNERFQRRRCLGKIVYGRRTTHDARRTTYDDGRRTKTDHNSSPWALCLWKHWDLPHTLHVRGHVTIARIGSWQRSGFTAQPWGSRSLQVSLAWMKCKTSVVNITL